MKRTRRNFKKYVNNYIIDIKNIGRIVLEFLKEYYFIIIIYLIILITILLSIKDVNKKYDRIYEIQQNQINEMIEMEKKIK